MANIVITQTGNSVLLTYNLQTQFGIPNKSIRLNSLTSLEINGEVIVGLNNGELLILTGDATETDDNIGIVDSVKGVATTTDTLLFTELEKIFQL